MTIEIPTPVHSAFATTTLAVSIGATGTAFAYNEDSAIRDCEKRLRSEYSLSDFRHQSAKKIPGEGHRYEVSGETKVDGKKHPFKCKIDDRYGACTMSDDGHVLKLATTGSGGGKQAGGELEQDGFYYDKHVGKWRDPAGDVCHTCTPENGFPKP